MRNSFFKHARENGIPFELLRGRIAGNIGKIIARILQKAQIGCLAVFGGDTLFSVMEELGCEGIFPVSEISPGVAAGRITAPCGTLNIVTKSGGLGAENVFMLMDEFLFSRGGRGS